MTILLLEDKLGITTGYMDIWESLVMGAGMYPSTIRKFSTWKSPIASRHTLLTRKGNRKSPGFNPDPVVIQALTTWVSYTVSQVKADMIMCMDTALLGLVEPSWDIATIDNMRGGVYDFQGLPWLVITPVSAVHNQKKPKDIRAMNDGAESKDEFEEQDHEEEDFFVEPYTIPFGKRILSADLRKAARIYAQVRQDARRPNHISG